MLVPIFTVEDIVLLISSLVSLLLNSPFTNSKIASRLLQSIFLAFASIVIYEKKLLMVVESKYFFKLTGIHTLIGFLLTFSPW